MRVRDPVLCIAALITLTACQGRPTFKEPLHFYDGGPRPASDLAVLAVIPARGPSVTAVDGKPLPSAGFTNGHSYLYVAPGPHKVTLALNAAVGRGIMSGDTEIEHAFVAGHVYVPAGQIDVNQKTMKAWIEDKGTNFKLACLPYRALLAHGRSDYYETNGCP